MQHLEAALEVYHLEVVEVEEIAKNNQVLVSHFGYGSCVDDEHINHRPRHHQILAQDVLRLICR